MKNSVNLLKKDPLFYGFQCEKSEKFRILREDRSRLFSNPESGMALKPGVSAEIREYFDNGDKIQKRFFQNHKK